jgi:hypothetical protein
MRPSVRQVVITAVFALVVAICTPVCVHRHDFDVALSRWMKDQSIENTLVLKAEARKSRWIALKAQIVAGCVAFLLLNGVWFMVRRVTHSGSFPAPKAGQVKWRFGRSRWRDGVKNLGPRECSAPAHLSIGY